MDAVFVCRFVWSLAGRLSHAFVRYTRRRPNALRFCRRDACILATLYAGAAFASYTLSVSGGLLGAEGSPEIKGIRFLKPMAERPTAICRFRALLKRNPSFLHDPTSNFRLYRKTLSSLQCCRARGCCNRIQTAYCIGQKNARFTCGRNEHG